MCVWPVIIARSRTSTATSTRNFTWWSAAWTRSWRAAGSTECSSVCCPTTTKERWISPRKPSFLFCFLFCLVLFLFFYRKMSKRWSLVLSVYLVFFLVFFFLTNQQGHSAGGRRHRRIQRQRARHPARNDGLHRVHARSLSAAGKKKETKPNQTNPHRPLRRSRRSVSSKSRGVGVPPSERSGRSMTALNSVLCCCCCCCCSFLLIRPNGRLANQFGGPPVRLIYCGTEADLFSFFFFHFSCCCRFLLK